MTKYVVERQLHGVDNWQTLVLFPGNIRVSPSSFL